MVYKVFASSQRFYKSPLSRLELRSLDDALNKTRTRFAIRPKLARSIIAALLENLTEEKAAAERSTQFRVGGFGAIMIAVTVHMNALVRFVGLLVISGALHADWSDYKAVSLSEAWAQAGVGFDQSIDTYISAPQDSRFLSIYTGQIRRIAGRRSDLIVNWGKAMGTPAQAAFENEIQVSADGLTVWLPIQESLMNEFVQEAKVRAPFNVWIMYIGGSQLEFETSLRGWN